MVGPGGVFLTISSPASGGAKRLIKRFGINSETPHPESLIHISYNLLQVNDSPL